MTGHARYCTCDAREKRWAQIELDAKRYRAIRWARKDDGDLTVTAAWVDLCLAPFTSDGYDAAADALIKLMEADDEHA